ncbi:hypothetical protein H6775_00415 [Candidatus Nomurabacteria bacterium]|nr:hypothetical protein [Candidatus Nomurabacteria bacterium]
MGYLSKTNLHHAYICEGDKKEIYNNLCTFCQNDLNFKIKANPDFVYEEYDKLLISHARRLRDIQMNKTTDRGRKIYIISFNFITIEAQNALLKVLEEPTEGTHFFFITPSAHIFLPTVLSRVNVISYKKSLDRVSSNFLKKSLKEKMNLVTKMVNDIKDEKVSKFEAIVFAREVALDIYNDAKKKNDYQKLKKLSEIEKIIDYLHSTGSSVKQLLEYLVLLT